MKLLNFLFCFLFLSAGIQAQQYCIAGRFSQTTLYSLTEIKSDTGVVFAESFNPFSGKREKLKMNLYYPRANRDTMSKRPVILCMHGGGFVFGDRGLCEPLSKEFARRGYIAATIDYRLGWNCSGDDFCEDCIEDTLSLRQSLYMAVQDLRAAQRYLTANSAMYRLNPDAFFLSGTSSGAMIAFSSVIFDQQTAEKFAPGATALLGELDTAGNAYRNSCKVLGISSFCGAVPGDTSFLARLNVPVISFHDEDDCIVPYSAGTIFGCNCSIFFPCSGPLSMYNYLIAHGRTAQINTMPGSGSHCSFPDADVTAGTACFFKQILCSALQSGSQRGSPVHVDCDSLQGGFQK